MISHTIILINVIILTCTFYNVNQIYSSEIYMYEFYNFIYKHVFIMSQIWLENCYNNEYTSNLITTLNKKMLQYFFNGLFTPRWKTTMKSESSYFYNKLK